MERITFINSLMSFNRRVLANGKLDKSKTYIAEDIKKKLLFNKIFISNTHEMFQKYNCDGIVDSYIESLN